MSRAVVITICLQDGRYHGSGEDPPSPARLFQALVAGAGLGGPLDQQVVDALTWLEKCHAPVIAAPVMEVGQSVANYVPNNDLDSVQGDPRRTGGIRTQKFIQPRLFDASVPFIYAWPFEASEQNEHQAKAICTLAERLYQFGRGVDMAWAWGEVVGHEEAEAVLSTYSGIVFRPSRRGGGKMLACPSQGTLKSLMARHAAASQRFKTVVQDKAIKQLFSQQPKAHFVQVAYESPPSRRVYELRQGTSESSFAVWPSAQVSKLVVELRDRAVERLRGGLSNQRSEIERILVGRKADGADDGPTSSRVKIVPLPSIGHPHSDHGIRRVLVEVPAECTLHAGDVHWAFSGLELPSLATGAIPSSTIIPSADDSMCEHYGIGERTFRVWRTVTPVAVPEAAKRRRIDPGRVSADAKNGSERAGEQGRAAGAVIQALHFAGIRAWVDLIRLQREPFEANGARVEEFAPGTRFAKERLWHVEIVFGEPIAGPLLIGDGRFLGLGLMAPLK